MVDRNLEFSNLVRDLAVDDLAWLADELMQPLPDKRYVIFFTARSGSSWLTNILSATKRLGQPEEYLNPNFIRKVASAVNATEPEAFLTGLQRRRKTANGVFGLEVRSVDVELFGTEPFFRIFGGGALYFNLWRRNMVAQAISLFRAAETQQYHVKEGEASTTPPAYDTKAVAKWMLHLALQENANLDMLVRQQRPFINLCYEEMVAGRQQTQEIFAAALDVALSANDPLAAGETRLTKIGDEWNRDVEHRFRADAAGLIAKIEANRRIKFHTIGRGNGEIIRPWTPATRPPLRLVKTA